MKKTEGNGNDGKGSSREIRETCSRCAGTGLVCGHVPVITPGACCVDYANAICPDCGGRGVEVQKVNDE